MMLEKITSKVQRVLEIAQDDVVEISTQNPRCSVMQVSFNTDDCTAGSVAVLVKYSPYSSWEVNVDEDGAPLEVDLVSTTTGKSFQLTNSWVYDIKFVTTGVVGNFDITLEEDSISGIGCSV